MDNTTTNNHDLSELKRLAIFAIVVEQGSFSQAAQVLRISRSRVSEQVSLLEQAFKVRLLQRTTRTLTLTREGESIYTKAALILETFDQIKSDLLQDELSGRVRITTTNDVATNWLNPRLHAFHEQYPNIRFEIIISDSRTDLIKDKIDLAIRTGELHDESLIVRPLFSDHLRLLTSNRVIEAMNKKLTIESVQECTWLLLPQIHPNPQITLFNDQQKVRFTPQKYHICDSPSVLLGMIKSGMGIGFYLPKLLQESDYRYVQPILSDWYVSELFTSIVYPSRKQLPSRTRCVIDYLMQAT